MTANTQTTGKPAAPGTAPVADLIALSHSLDRFAEAVTQIAAMVRHVATAHEEGRTAPDADQNFDPQPPEKLIAGAPEAELAETAEKPREAEKQPPQSGNPQIAAQDEAEQAAARVCDAAPMSFADLAAGVRDALGDVAPGDRAQIQRQALKVIGEATFRDVPPEKRAAALQAVRDAVAVYGESHG